MSDVIDFNDLKNKVRDKDIDDFEAYIFNLYGEMGTGKQTIASINKAIMEYMEKNSISYEKFMEIQTRLMERYGVSMEDIQSQYNLTNNEDYQKYRKQLGFMDKYKGKLKEYSGFHYEIRNERNELTVFLNKTIVVITSEKQVDLADNELNEFLVSYKKLQDDATLQIRISENYREYDY
ncbi:DUF3867 family protein [Proteiniclasticum sp. SCR006]|uniref:DUF3867 family protein n=1 Tax=Proteiniclasticum aestuarii TaxID=2817862 RepID=A0A939HAX3_9CLOT|nr:DUF3867 family protein [Proteiniclasticum aestuarii]MBO1263948.1 DUF3867 family protein [Proteiniclasticum aestuarii]